MKKRLLSIMMLSIMLLSVTTVSAADRNRDRDKLQDGSCQIESINEECTQDQLHDQIKIKDQLKDRLHDGSCLTDLIVANMLKTQTKDQKKDGSCLV